MTKRKVVLTTEVLDPLFLHWGVAKDEPNQWLLPDESLWPEGTVAVSHMARLRGRARSGSVLGNASPTDPRPLARPA